MALPIILKDKLFIPAKLVDEELLNHHYNKQYFDQAKCEKCEVYQEGERFSSTCATCPHYKGQVQLYDEFEFKGKDYFGLPSGNIDKVFKLLDLDADLKDTIKDKRVQVPVVGKWRWKKDMPLRDGKKKGEADQISIVSEFLENPHGFIILNPRAGKTVVASNIFVKLKQRLLVLVHESALADQFLERLREFTNLNEIATKKRPLAGIYKRESDFKLYEDVVIMTYQSLIKDGGRRIRKFIKGKFGAVLVDEADLASSACFSDVVDQMDAYHRIALSATTKRKDMINVHFDLLGPIRVRYDIKGMDVTVHTIDTGIKPADDIKHYAIAVTWLANHKKRNKMVADYAIKILESDKNRSVLIACMRRKQVTELTERINLHFGERVAQGYTSNTTEFKKRILNNARSGKTRVVVGIQSMVRRGVNVPEWTDLILQMPIASKLSPDPEFVQLSQRVCTPKPGKPEPMIHFFVDDMGLSHGCFTSTIFKSAQPMGYKCNQATWDMVKKINASRGKKKRSFSDGTKEGTSKLLW